MEIKLIYWYKMWFEPEQCARIYWNNAKKSLKN